MSLVKSKTIGSYIPEIIMTEYDVLTVVYAVTVMTVLVITYNKLGAGKGAGSVTAVAMTTAFITMPALWAFSLITGSVVSFAAALVAKKAIKSAVGIKANKKAEQVCLSRRAFLQKAGKTAYKAAVPAHARLAVSLVTAKGDSAKEKVVKAYVVRKLTPAPVRMAKVIAPLMAA